MAELAWPECGVPAWRRLVQRALAGSGVLVAGLLAGCAALSPAPPSPEPLLHDALFDHPLRPADADSLMAVSEPMRQHARQLLRATPRAADLPAALARSLYQAGELQLDYDATVTRNAAQAFDHRAGNCLSLVLMTAALAHELGLEVGYQAVTSDDLLRSEANLTMRTGHVNLVLGRHQPPLPLGDVRVDLDRGRVLIDFLPPDEARRLPTERIDEQRVLAMAMNNRAVEALIARQPAQAYAWAREAVRQDGRFWPAWNTLGVVYQRAGHLDAAAAVFEQLLGQDERQVATLGNLAQVREAQGRHAEAEAWTRRRLALEPYPPFHFLRLGQAALAAGDAAQARRHFNRQIQQQGPSHEAWFGLARAQLALGQPALAEQALRSALQASATSAEQSRYAGKLAALRASLAH